MSLIETLFRMSFTRSLAPVAIAFLCASSAYSQDNNGPIVLEKMGAFSFGGVVKTDSDGEKLYCDHGYTDFYTPKDAKPLPLLFWHSSSTLTWEMTPDGRDGFESIFLRRNYPVYIMDMPRQGRASNGCEKQVYEPDYGGEQYTFENRRFGTWASPSAAPVYYKGMQIPANNPEWQDQLARARYSEAEGKDAQIRNAGAVSQLLDKVGGGVLITHSGSAIPGWITATKSDKVKAIVAFEPAQFVYPKGSVPPARTNPFTGKPLDPGGELSVEDYQKLTKFPILLIFGDFIPETSTSDKGAERWRIRRQQYAEEFAKSVNDMGGNVKIVDLPKLGIKGNSHISMVELNNQDVAQVVADFLDKVPTNDR